jgi:hypothetical protein
MNLAKKTEMVEEMKQDLKLYLGKDHNSVSGRNGRKEERWRQTDI